MSRVVATQAELAEALGVRVSGIQYYKRAGAPGKGPDGYDVDAWERWRAANVDAPRGGGKRGSAEEGVGDRSRLLKAQADERRAKADLAGLKLAIERKDYIAKSEIEEWDRARIAVVKRGLMALPRKVSCGLVGLMEQEIEVVLMREIRDLLTRFASMK